MNPRQRKYLQELKSQREDSESTSGTECTFIEWLADPKQVKELEKAIKQLEKEKERIKEKYSHPQPVVNAHTDGSITVTFPDDCYQCDKYTGATAENRTITYKAGESVGCGLIQWLIVLEKDGTKTYSWTPPITDSVRPTIPNCYRFKGTIRPLSEIGKHVDKVRIKFYSDDSVLITSPEGYEYHLIPKPAKKNSKLNKYCTEEIINNDLKLTPTYLTRGYLDDYNISIIADLLRLGTSLDPGAKPKLTKQNKREAIGEYSDYLCKKTRNTNVAEKIAAKYGITLTSLKQLHSRSQKK
jgi:hypothetical protein